jgi:hypothetical protein
MFSVACVLYGFSVECVPYGFYSINAPFDESMRRLCMAGNDCVFYAEWFFYGFYMYVECVLY